MDGCGIGVCSGGGGEVTVAMADRWRGDDDGHCDGDGDGVGDDSDSGDDSYGARWQRWPWRYWG